MNQLDTPILFLTFNRPDLTQRVFDEIRKARPKQLFWVCDGARNETEKELVEKTRKIIDQIDWDCKIKTNFSNKNLGCKIRVSSGIDWFFENVEQGIILEDDCLPNQSFFEFCEKLLNKYKNDKKIMHIGGTNFQDGKWRGDGSYYFSKYAHIWGWATWKRAWNHYDINLTNTDIDTWDYQWQNSVEEKGGLSIIPNKNLVSNIGFREDGTHTTSKDSIKANIGTELLIEIIHPDKIKINGQADNYTNKKFNKGKKIMETTLKKIYWKIRSVLNKLKKNKIKVKKVKKGYAKNIKLIILSNTPQIYKKMIEGNYENYIAENLLKKISPKGKTIWDVGAHFGYQSFVFSRLAGNEGKVISFEPNPSNIKTFVENLKNNRELKRNVFLKQKGLSNKQGIVSFNVSRVENSSATSGGYLSKVTPPLSKPSYKDFVEIKINIDTMDSMINTGEVPSPDIIKIDIEGGELDTLQGGLNTLKTKKPVLIIEIHSDLLFDQVTSLLSRIGYKIEKIDETKNITTIIAN